MKLTEARHIYFIGIGGIGMSALARLFMSRGIRISGYDRTETALTLALQEEGAEIHYDDDPSKVPDDADFYVYTPAIPKQHKGLIKARASGIPLLKRAEVLGMLSRDLFTAAIAGTHGKTSISSMVAHILAHENHDVTGLIGGIVKNYQSNLVVNGKGSRFVVEADEYDRSFHQLRPDIALISVIDPDHLDIYGSFEQMQRDFRVFARGIKTGGKLLLHSAIDWEETDGHEILRYGPGGEFHISGYSKAEGSVALRFELNGEQTPEFNYHLPGMHNAENALGAAAMASLIGIDAAGIARSLEAYQGVVRRFDIRCTGERFVYIDDYAHHPAELNAAIQAVRDFYPDRYIIGVFQPHLYWRTRDFADGFAHALDQLDEAYLMEIYPARELPIPGVNSEMIANRMSHASKILDESQVIQLAERCSDCVFLTLGAGDIDRLVAPLSSVFDQRQERSKHED